MDPGFRRDDGIVAEPMHVRSLKSHDVEEFYPRFMLVGGRVCQRGLARKIRLRPRYPKWSNGWLRDKTIEKHDEEVRRHVPRSHQYC